MSNDKGGESELARPAIEVLGLAGSPRRQGNSETLLDAALDGARTAGAAVNKIILNELKFSGCQNCGFCAKEGYCRIKDDMSIVYEALDRADRVILASPIYFTNVSAQAKMMVDRCQPYWARKYVLKLPPKKQNRSGAFLCLGGFKKGEKFFDCSRFLVEVWMINLDVKLAHALYTPGIDAFGEIKKHPDALEQALSIGKALAS